MEIREILRELGTYTGKFPREALRAAIERCEEITPELLRILERAASRVDALVAEPEYMAYLYAMYLLAQFRETRAHALIVQFFSTPGKRAHSTFLGEAVECPVSRRSAHSSCPPLAGPAMYVLGASLWARSLSGLAGHVGCAQHWSCWRRP